MGEFTLKELRKLRRAYFKISTMEEYLDWKDSILLLFCSVHDLDTLARNKGYITCCANQWDSNNCNQVYVGRFYKGGGKSKPSSKYHILCM